MVKNKNLLAYCYLVGAVMLWGGNWVAVRYAVQTMPPMVVVTTRAVLSAIVLVAVLYLTKGRKISLQGLKIFFILGVFLFGFNILQYTGLQYTTAINGSLINALTPIIIILLSRIFIKEKLSPIQLLGVVISFVSVGWVITNGSLDLLASMNFNIGDILVFLAAISWGSYTVYGKKPTLEYSALYVTALASIFSAIFFLPFGITEYQANPIETVTVGMIIAIIYVVAVAVLGLVAWIKGVSLIGPSRASIFMNLMPLFTLIFGFILLGETLTIQQLIGGVFVIGGVYLTTNQRFVAKPVIAAEKTQT